MAFPTPWTVRRLPWETSGTDPHGNPISGWGDPVDVAVYGWSIPTSNSPNPGADDRVVVDLELFAPPDLMVTSRDRFEIPDGPNAGVYTVVGEIADFTRGPFGWSPGVVLRLRRVEG